MGKDKKTTTQDTRQTTTIQPTEQEQRQLDRLEEQQIAGQEGIVGLSSLIPETLTGILSGGEGLPDAFTKLFAGISPEAISAESNRLVQEGLVGGQLGGIADSGVLQKSITQDVAERLLLPAEQSNLARVFDLLGLGLSGGQGQQQLATQGSAAFGNQLAGLRGQTVAGTGSTTTLGMNPFLRSFQTSFGSTLGKQLPGAGASGLQTLFG